MLTESYGNFGLEHNGYNGSHLGGGQQPDTLTLQRAISHRALTPATPN